jgi:hypothetical protein
VASSGANQWLGAARGSGNRPTAQLVWCEEEEGRGVFSHGCDHVGEAETGWGAGVGVGQMGWRWPKRGRGEDEAARAGKRWEGGPAGENGPGLIGRLGQKYSGIRKRILIPFGYFGLLFEWIQIDLIGF